MKRITVINKIGVKLLLTTVFCLFLSLYASSIFAKIAVLYGLPEKANVGVLAYTLFAMGISVYIFSFLLIVNRKVKYIKYIAKSVKKISNEDLGATIEIRGNDELAELSASINEMSRELKYRREKEKEIENAKNDLISNVSHDLRTPLTSITGYVDLLKRKEYKNEEELNEYVDVIYHKSQNLQILINELFEYTKLTTPGIRINSSTVDLSGLLEQLVGEYIPILSREGLTIERDIPVQDIYVTVDIEKIVRVFENILTNARKYSPKPSVIHVKLYKQDNKATVSITNRTDRIPVENLDLLFEKFYRVDTSRKDSEGAGLGLAIAKRIVELHGGRIWADCREDRITFAVELQSDIECL